MPDQSLVLGAAGGSFTSLVLAILRQVAFEDSIKLEPAISTVKDCFCNFDIDLWDRQSIQIFLLGLLTGLLVGPLVDLLWIVRERWRRFILARVVAGSAASPKALYKVI